MVSSATRFPGSDLSYCSAKRGSNSGMYVCFPQSLTSVFFNDSYSSTISSSDAERILPTTSFSVSPLKCVSELLVNRDLRMGMVVKSCWISGSGFQPTKTSNFPRATAISGLWLASPNFSGSFLWSLAARPLSGWIWRGRALAIERI